MNGIRYKIFKQYNLVIEKAEGQIEKADFINMLSRLYKLDEYVGITRVLTDLRGVKLIYKMSDIDEIAAFIRTESNNPTMVYHAVLTDEPSLTAVSLIFQYAGKDIPDYSCKVFSTNSGAAKFLDLPLEVIEATILDIK